MATASFCFCTLTTVAWHHPNLVHYPGRLFLFVLHFAHGITGEHSALRPALAAIRCV